MKEANQKVEEGSRGLNKRARKLNLDMSKVKGTVKPIKKGRTDKSRGNLASDKAANVSSFKRSRNEAFDAEFYRRVIEGDARQKIELNQQLGDNLAGEIAGHDSEHRIHTGLGDKEPGNMAGCQADG